MTCPPPAGRPNVPVSAGFVVSMLAGVVLFFYAVRFVLAPFIFAAVLAFLLNPFVSFFETRGIRRDRAVLLLFLVLVIVTAGLSYWGFVALWGELPSLRSSWPQYMDRAQSAMNKVQKALEFQWPYLQRSRVLERAMAGVMEWIEGHLWRSRVFYTSVLEWIVHVILSPFIAFFFLRGGSRAAQIALDACPGNWVERLLSLLDKFGRVFGSYMRGLLLESFLVGLLTALILQWMGLDYAALIGIITGIANVVPYFGPVLGGVVGIGAAVFQYSNISGPLQVAVFFLLIHYVDSWILQPAIMNKAVNLNPVTVTFALLCGANLGGLWGLVFAVPVAGLIKEAGYVFYDWYRAERGLIIPSKEFAAAAAKPWIV